MTFKKEKILVVDDNNDMLDLIQRQLKSFHYRTYKASSVNEAIEVLKSSDIHLLISDLNMPNINWSRNINCSRATDRRWICYHKCRARININCQIRNCGTVTWST